MTRFPRADNPVWPGPVTLVIQGGVVRRFGVAGLSTTYPTGTLTTIVMRPAWRR